MLYTKDEDQFRPATEAEIISACSRIMSGRRKTKSGGRPPALDAANSKRALAMLAQGRPQTEIAAKLGVTQSTISRLSREAS